MTLLLALMPPKQEVTELTSCPCCLPDGRSGRQLDWERRPRMSSPCTTSKPRPTSTPAKRTSLPRLLLGPRTSSRLRGWWRICAPAWGPRTTSRTACDQRRVGHACKQGCLGRRLQEATRSFMSGCTCVCGTRGESLLRPCMHSAVPNCPQCTLTSSIALKRCASPARATFCEAAVPHDIDPIWGMHADTQSMTAIMA